MSRFAFRAQREAAPTAPPASEASVYLDDLGVWHWIDDLGVDTPIGAAAGGGSGVAWREFTSLADAVGVTKSNIGTSFVEVGAASNRNKVDISGFADCRAVVGVNKVGGGTQEWKYQYSLDQSVWLDLTSAIADAAAAGEKLLDSAWAAIPAGALVSEIYIRVVGKSSTATDDPVVRTARLQVR